MAQSGHSVIVVGGGLAGLSAAVEAARAGAKVTVVEKEKALGGNSAKATSGINAVGTRLQQGQGVVDTVQLFAEDTLRSGDGLAVEALVNVLAANSAECIQWLEDTLGLQFDSLVQLGGHRAPRTHRFKATPEGKPVPVGFTIMAHLRKHVETVLAEQVTVLTECRFRSLYLVEGAVRGMTYEDAEGKVHALMGSVVLCSGGYANDHMADSLLAQHAPQLQALPTTNGPWATGDVIKATRDAHLTLTLMDKVQVHPTGFVLPSDPQNSTKFLAPEALRGCGAILLDAHGKRFVDELGRRDHLTTRLFEHATPFLAHPDYPVGALMLMTDAVLDRYGRPAVGFYEFKGLIKGLPDLNAVAGELGVDHAVLVDTLAQYRAAAAAGKDEFGKTVFPEVFSTEGKFYVSYITPSLHYCMGGIAITPTAQVLQDSPTGPRVVPGLFAGGEQAGGVHGENRLGGNSLMECVVFGRIAGRGATAP